jgi:hypothetical protein
MDRVQRIDRVSRRSAWLHEERMRRAWEAERLERLRRQGVRL